MMIGRIVMYSAWAVGVARASREQAQVAMGSTQFYLYGLLSLLISCFAGLCSGLTVGYMSISKTEMQLAAQGENQVERRKAEAILGLLANHHLLLSTLLLSNALSLEALPIFLDKIVPSYLAVIISTAAVVVFGQVLPQAYCTGKSKVAIAGFFAPFVVFLQKLLYVFVRPIVYVLDNWLGHSHQKIQLTTENMQNLLKLHDKKQFNYHPEQIKMLQNTINLRTMSVDSCMCALDKLSAVEENAKLDTTLLLLLKKSNYSKVLIFAEQRHNLVGYMHVKHLLPLSLDGRTIRECRLIKRIPKISVKASLLVALETLRKQKASVAGVVDDNNICIGSIHIASIFNQLTLSKAVTGQEHVWHETQALEQD